MFNFHHRCVIVTLGSFEPFYLDTLFHKIIIGDSIPHSNLQISLYKFNNVMQTDEVTYMETTFRVLCPSYSTQMQQQNSLDTVTKWKRHRERGWKRDEESHAGILKAQQQQHQHGKCIKRTCRAARETTQCTVLREQVNRSLAGWLASKPSPLSKRQQ